MSETHRDAGGIFSWVQGDLLSADRRIKVGLPARTLLQLQAWLELTKKELATVVLIPPRTLARRLHEERLPPAESERVYRIARMLERASEVLGGPEAARAWMKEPNFALGDRAPLELISTQPGAELVAELLGRIEHGIPA